MKVALFVPCFVDAAFPAVGRATVAVLERLGVRVEVPAGYTCCGQPAFNAGRWAEARAVAALALDAFGGADAVVVPAGSCATMLRNFTGKLFADAGPSEALARQLSARTFELSEFLVERLGVTDVGAHFPARVTLHDACHALRELRIAGAPRKLLGAVRGLELVEMDAADACCGFGGTFAVKHAPVSVAMDELKVASVERTGADVVTSLDASCLAQIGGLLTKRNSRVRALHLAEILAAT